MARKSMNIVDVMAWLKRSAEWAVGRHIANIYFDKHANLIFVKLKGGKIILAEPGKRVHLTMRRQPPSEFKPDPLVVLARKYMRNRRLKALGQLNQDRIVYFESEPGYKLIIELVPRGVGILVAPDGSILAATKYLRVRDREIRPRKSYVPPPSRGKPLDEIAPSDVLIAVTTRGKLVSGLVSVLGVPGELAEEAAYRLGLEPDLKEIDEAAAEELVAMLRNILDEALEGKGYIVSKNGTYIEVDPFRPTRFEEEDYMIREYENFDLALEDYFETPVPTARESVAKSEVQLEREKLEASLERARKQAVEYRREAERLRSIADYISRNYHRFEIIINCIRKSDIQCIKDLGATVEKLNNTYRIMINDLELYIPVYVKNVDELILEYFKKAGILEAKAERAEYSTIDIQKRLEELEIKVKARDIAERYKRRRRYWFENFHYTVTRNGFLVIGGKDASQNELIVRKYLDSNDIFMHADIHGAPAVVLKTRGKTVEQGDLIDAAIIAVAYSKAWKSGLGSLRVFYVNADQVSLSPPTGEYLAKGGIMIYGKKNYLPPIPVRIWLGVVLDVEGIPRLIQGSSEVVSSYTIGYGSLIPGDSKRIEIARELKKRLAEILGDASVYALALPDEDIASRIPGRSRLTGVYKGEGEPIDFSSLAGH